MDQVYVKIHKNLKSLYSNLYVCKEERVRYPAFKHTVNIMLRIKKYILLCYSMAMRKKNWIVYLI